MITAVDTNVLLDVFTQDVNFCASSARALRKALQDGEVIVSDIVWAETAASFPVHDTFRDAMQTLGIKFSPMTTQAAEKAGHLWKVARKIPGSKRDGRMFADFLVAAHAEAQADCLLSRDRGFCNPLSFSGASVKIRYDQTKLTGKSTTRLELWRYTESDGTWTRLTKLSAGARPDDLCISGSFAGVATSESTGDTYNLGTFAVVEREIGGMVILFR